MTEDEGKEAGGWPREGKRQGSQEFLRSPPASGLHFGEAYCPLHVGAEYFRGSCLWTRWGLVLFNPRSPGVEPEQTSVCLLPWRLKCRSLSLGVLIHTCPGETCAKGRRLPPVTWSADSGLAPAWGLRKSLGVAWCEEKLRNLGLRQGLGAWDN